MSVHLPARYVLPAAAVVTGGLWWWMTAGVSGADRTVVAWYGGVAAAVVCAAVTVAAYCAQTARHHRSRIAALDAQVARLADETLPAVVRRVRDGASVDTALAGVPDSVDGAHRR